MIAHGLLVERRDEGTTVGLERDPALLLERDECLAHRDATDAERLGDVVLVDAVARPR